MARPTDLDGEPRDRQIRARVSTPELARFTLAAKLERIPFSRWIRAALNKRADRTLGKKGKDRT